MHLQIFVSIIINIFGIVYSLKLNLYTRLNPKNRYTLTLDESGENLKNSNINLAFPIKLLIPGWRDEHNESWLMDMRDNYLEVDNYNVIIVDWDSISQSYNYPAVVNGLQSVAVDISLYLEIMKHESFDLNNLHIVGFGVGAHLAGFIGHRFGGKIGRITALDAAGPGFNKDGNRLHKEDAKFVDVIHTCTGVLGATMTLGHTDYYVNEGTCGQPGCSAFNVFCGHSRAYLYMIESIKNPHAFLAEYHYCIKKGKVDLCRPRENTYMGEGATKKHGQFKLSTNSQAPLCTIAFALADGKRIYGVNIAENNIVLQKEVDDIRYKRSNDHVTDNKTNVVKSILNRLNEGERQVKYAEDANIVLVLGNTGAGKSTFVQFMAGNNLSSVAVLNSRGIKTGKYIIIDEHAKIGTSSVNSHTEVPDLVIDVKTNTSIYDCPGFSDTRDAEHDIAGTYFIKKVTDIAKKIKFVFMVNYSSVQSGYDRTDFMRLLKHATNMIKNITKYQDSIAIVATKVDNNESNNEVITTITAFLEEVKQELIKKPDLNNNMIQFINALLTTNETEDQIYTKIGFFKKPNKAGLLSTMKTFQDNKKSLEKLLHNNTKFIEIDNSDDFGYTISADSQIYVLDLVKEIKNNISSSVADIANLVQEHYRISIQKMLNKINLFSSSMDTIDANVIEAQSFSTHINSGYDKILNLIKEIKNVKSAEELSTMIGSSLNFLNLDIIRNKVSVISDQGRYLKFLAKVSVNEFNSSDLSISSDPFQSIVKYLNESKNRIYKNIIDVEYQLKNKIQNNINDIGTKIKNYFSKKEEEFYAIKNLNHDIESTYYKLSEIQKTENDNTEIDKCIQKISDNIYELNITDKDIISANNILSNSVKNGIYLQFLYALKGESKTHSFRCADSLNNVIRYLDNSKQFYHFIISLHERLSSYDIQLDPKVCYNFLTGVTWSNESTKAGDIISQQFINRCYPEYKNDLKYITLDESQWLILDKILKLTLTSDINVFCDSDLRNKLVIKGQYVKLSDIKKHNCKTPLESIHIFALEKIFIDIDFNDPTIKEMIILSPTWDVQGTHKIILDGSPGKPHDTQKAQDGIGNATNGEHGKPGLPGSPGKNFLGISRKVNNAYGLTISANGGRGGPGQSGGDGGKGYDGVTPGHNNLGPYTDMDKDLCQTFQCELTKIRPQNWFESLTSVDKKDIYTVYGSNGRLGGDGGHGGRGGYGGHPGNVIFLTLLSNDAWPINISSNTGDIGTDGHGGDIGKNGTLGKDLHVRVTITPGAMNTGSTHYETTWKYKPAQNDTGPKSNAPGIAGKYEEGILNPDQVKFINLFYPINNYKSYLRENLIDNVRQSELIDFYNLLERNESKSIFVSNFYDTLGFLDEFHSLEQQFFKLHKKISFLPFYESLFNRVNHYKEKMRNDTNNEEYQTLKYLRTTIFSKIHGIKNDPDKNLVVNVASYFESVKKHITLYKNDLKQVNIDEYNENYQKIIQKQIHEANDLINNDILPEIYGILKETNENIMLLEKETISLINIAASEKKEIEEAKKKLEGLMIAKTMLSGIEIAGAVLSLAGPVGVAVGLGTALVAEVAQSGIRKKSQKVTQTQVTSLPDSVSRPIEMVTNLLKIEKKIFQEQLHDVMKEFNEFPNENNMSDIKNEIENTQEQVNKITPNDMARNSSSVDLMKTLRKKLKKSLEKKQKKLESKQSDNDKNNKSDNNKNIKRKLKVIKKSKKHLSKACKALRFNEDSTDHIEGLDEDIEKVNEKIDKLEKYEENIYNIIIPMIQFIEKLFTETRENLNGKSHMALDVSKWKMQSILKDVQIQIREMTQGFNVQVSLIRCIEKFEYGVVTVIQMYDRIQDAYEKKQLTNYIADINSEVKSTSNEKYRNAINKLDLILRSNLVLNEYVHAMSAFEQDIFPYADMYLSQFEMNYTNNNLNDFVDEAVKRITELSDTVVKHSSTLNPTIDNYFHRKTVFHSDSSGPGEFFVWKHEEYHEEISKLLKGKAITIKADIVKGIKHNAVKFNEIGLQFKLSNTTLQQELNTQLKPFVIKMTHLGDSYYKCGNQFYIINHDQQMISHHVISESGTYANENNVYSKIKENPPILSPYSMWKLQLQHSNKSAFKKLIKFAHESIDLGLVGKGQYVDTEDSVCNDSLEKYYKVADIQSTIN
ncbi:hypothetical protein HCN44_008144 [Aphidius gifuensis]|uniref:phospholipase A1 n=1 Tax=Aphidius gifuensis TaxID=684658 RepID=A0A834XQ60_APHGI|nr:hypothetical protein HCN44_008144 [Aphidius gifuensis]